MFSSSVFGMYSVSRWSYVRRVLAGVLLTVVLLMVAAVVPAQAEDPDNLIFDLFEDSTLAHWDLIGDVQPVLSPGNLQGVWVVDIEVPESNGIVGGGTPGGICQNHRAVGQGQIGLWVDLTQLDLKVPDNFKLITLSPSETSNATAGVWLWRGSGGVFKVRIFAREIDNTLVQSSWHTIPKPVADNEAIYFRTSWKTTAGAVEGQGSFGLELFDSSGTFVMSIALGGLDTDNQAITYTRFGMLDAETGLNSSGNLLIDQIEMNEVNPVKVAPLGGPGSGTL